MHADHVWNILLAQYRVGKILLHYNEMLVFSNEIAVCGVQYAESRQ